MKVGYYLSPDGKRIVRLRTKNRRNHFFMSVRYTIKSKTTVRYMSGYGAERYLNDFMFLGKSFRGYKWGSE